ncbi:hypothetical protein [Streptomyces sp. NPDC057199]|uniref:hypothetical protein n=1 Tax=Streptomyces sp. NPDC057199 TaxID=3346047 RepID=UPI003635FFFE
MADTPGLRPEDQAQDLQAVLHLAPNTPDILGALRAAPIGRAATLLHVQALAEADKITAAAYGEYNTYLTYCARKASAEDTCTALARRRGCGGAGGGGSVPRARPGQARLGWQQALLERGTLPHVRRSIAKDPLLCPEPPPATPTTPQSGPRSPASSRDAPDGRADGPEHSPQQHRTRRRSTPCRST